MAICALEPAVRAFSTTARCETATTVRNTVAVAVGTQVATSPHAGVPGLGIHHGPLRRPASRVACGILQLKFQADDLKKSGA